MKMKSGKQKLTSLLFVMIMFAMIVPFMTVTPVLAGTVNVPGDYGTIQAAVIAASGGDKIIVDNGTYSEHVIVNKALTIQAKVGASPIVDGSGTGTCFLIQSSDVTIDGFIIQNAQWGIKTYGGPSTYSNIVISNNQILNHYWNGILVVHDTITGLTISGNIITAGCTSGQIGISFANNTTVTDLTIDGNDITGNCAGLSLIDAVFTNVAVTDCYFEGNSWEDIDLGLWGNGPTLSNVQISGCTFDGGGVWTAISVDGASVYGDSDVHINCNNFSGSGAGIYNLNSTIVDAEYNWWGNASGPSGDGSGSGVWVGNNVDFDPWLQIASLPGDCDSDGVDDADDLCPGTVSDEPSKRLGTNRWEWNRPDWETNAPGGGGPDIGFTMDDTLGCSCEQILAILEEKTGFDFDGHYKFGCASSILDDWISGMYYLETVEVPATSPGVDSQSDLMDGVDYLLKATGVANAGDTIDFDAKYSITNRISGDDWTDTVSGYESYGPTLLDLFVNGSSVDWGAYNNAHEYWYELAGGGDPVSFHVYDIYPINNTGSLSVDISAKLW